MADCGRIAEPARRSTPPSAFSILQISQSAGGLQSTPPMERISSRQNPLVKRFRDASRGASGEWMLLDGEHLIEEALTSGVRIDAAAFSDGLSNGRLAALAARTEGAGATTVAVTDQVLAVMSPVRQPSGAVAIAARR